MPCWGPFAGLVFALAAEPTEVVVLPEFDPRIPEPVRVELLGGVQHRMQQDGFTGVDPTAACAASPAECRSGRRIGLVVTQSGSDYAIEVRAYAEDGTVLETSTQDCRICRHDEIGGALVEAVAAVLPALAGPAKGTLSIVSSPSGSSVWVDGASVGVTPLELEVAPGAHQVRVERPGYRPRTITLEVAEGARASQAFELSKASSLAPKAEITLGWSAVAVGAAAAISGMVLLAIDEQEIRRECSGNDMDVDGDCRFLHDTLGAGVGLLVGGVVVAGGGTGLILHGRNRREQARKTSVGLGPMGIAGRF